MSPPRRACLALTALIALGATSCSTSTPAAHLTTSSPSRLAPSDTPAAPTAPTPIADPWRAYRTSVNPGSAVDFVTAGVGWRVAGQIFGPGIDANLGSGVVDNGSAWPGTSVQSTSNGGATWSTVLQITTGIWGIDFVSSTLGFAVGVTRLLGTSDGGDHWRQLGEPSGHTLVWVDFSSTVAGYGLTTNGQLVRTSDGGSSWSSTVLGRAAQAACFPGGEDGYAVSSTGALYATRDGGSSWSVLLNGPPKVEQFIGPWGDLSCSGTSLWLGLQLFCAAACGGTEPYLVEHSANDGTSWSKMASDWPGAAPVVAPAAHLAAVAAASSGAGVIATLPTDNFPSPPQLTVLFGRASGPVSTALVPRLPPSSAATPGLYVVVRGISFVGSRGWLYFDDTSLRSPRPGGEPVLWETTDGGTSWRFLDAGPTELPPALS
ncbi:MAG: WD40/YVTN/BNR-like repeat-containing protein [Acidimicrobiales bacterium]